MQKKIPVAMALAADMSYATRPSEERASRDEIKNAIEVCPPAFCGKRGRTCKIRDRQRIALDNKVRAMSQGNPYRVHGGGSNPARDFEEVFDETLTCITFIHNAHIEDYGQSATDTHPVLYLFRVVAENP